VSRSGQLRGAPGGEGSKRYRIRDQILVISVFCVNRHVLNVETKRRNLNHRAENRVRSLGQRSEEMKIEVLGKRVMMMPLLGQTSRVFGVFMVRMRVIRVLDRRGIRLGMHRNVMSVRNYLVEIQKGQDQNWGQQPRPWAIFTQDEHSSYNNHVRINLQPSKRCRPRRNFYTRKP